MARGLKIGEPFQDVASNHGRDDYWTCPGCYYDLGDVGEGNHTCPECGRTLSCSVEYEPVCRAEIVEAYDA